MLDSTELWACI